MNQIKINLEFGGALLPVAKNEAGQDVVPLKPICEVIGVDWANQHRKMQGSYLSRRLGTCIELILYAGQEREMFCIRLDRVSAFLYTINPDRVRVNGNEAAADYLERKHSEWDDLIHQYEVQNGQLIQKSASSKIISIRTFLAVSREIRMTENKKMRGALGAIAGNLATDVGIAYQPDLLDSSGS